MKKYKSFFTVLLVILTIVSSSQNAKGQVQGNWSGTASLVQTTIWMGGFKREKKVEVAFTDNIGRGSVIDIGKSSQGDTYCEGSGKATLNHVSISLGHNTYTIHIESPPCNGTSSTYKPGERVPYGPEVTDIVISDQPLRDPNVLAGSDTKVIDLGGGYNTTTIITWSLKRTSDVELIVKPEDYDNWLPAPGTNELMKGSVMKISLKVLGRNGQPPTLKARSFELRLSNTSKEPGITLNAPLVPSPNQLPDIRFLQHTLAESNKEDQFIKIPCRDGTTGEVFLGSYDGGGWTTLTAEAILEDGTRIPGHLLVTSGETEIPVPKRNPGTNIADSWLIANGNPVDNDDKETSAGNSNDGDGLTAYEEYRGVISEGKFRRLDPNKKELGVKIKRAELSFFSDGIIKFKNATGLEVIRFYETEIAANRRLNKNASSAHNYDQYVLNLLKDALQSNFSAESIGGPGIPLQVDRVVIDANNVNYSYRVHQAEAKEMNKPLPYTEKELLSTIIAHELAHGINVSHHGALDPSEANTMIIDGKRVGIIRHDGTYNLDRPFHLKGLVGATGNLQSGDLTCIMANNSLCDWTSRERADSVFFYQVPVIPIGTRLCDKRTGTGINEKDSQGNNNYFGDAIHPYGNCASQIKMKK